MFKKMKDSMQDSFKEFKNTRSLTVTAMLMAVSIVLGFFTIQVGDFLKIGFSSLPQQMVGMLFGPAVGGVFGGVADIVKYIIKPTGAFFPGFTISGIVSGLIYGFAFYKKPLKLSRVIVANVIIMIFVNMVMNTYWLTLLYGTGFFAILPGRVVKEIVMCVINTALVYTVCGTLKSVLALKKA